MSLADSGRSLGRQPSAASVKPDRCQKRGRSVAPLSSQPWTMPLCFCRCDRHSDAPWNIISRCRNALCHRETVERCSLCHVWLRRKRKKKCFIMLYFPSPCADSLCSCIGAHVLVCLCVSLCWVKIKRAQNSTWAVSAFYSVWCTEAHSPCPMRRLCDRSPSRRAHALSTLTHSAAAFVRDVQVCPCQRFVFFNAIDSVLLYIQNF